MPKVRVLTEYCKGCGLCIGVCPVEALECADELTALAIHPPRQKADVRCSGCLGCALICPDAAIEIVEVEESSEPQVKRAVATR
jgi:2-oxoglutarate ferredoxin oxidoreductase subunit delta